MTFSSLVPSGLQRNLWEMLVRLDIVAWKIPKDCLIMLYDALAAVCTHKSDHQWLSDLLNLGIHKNILLLLAKVSTKKMK